MLIRFLAVACGARCGSIRNCKFKIQDSKLNEAAGMLGRTFRFGTQPAGHACLQKQRASAGGGCGPPIPAGSILLAGSLQPLVVVEMLVGKIGRCATGSPQPPPGGGLQFASRRSAHARPSARLRACLELGSVRQDRADHSLPAAKAHSSATSLLIEPNFVQTKKPYQTPFRE